MLNALAAAVLLLATSPDRTFVNLGNNRGVPASAVRQYAIEHGVAVREAAHRIAAQMAAADRHHQASE